METPNNNAIGAEGKVLLYTVNGKQYESKSQYLTGAEIRKSADAPDESPESMLFLSVKHPWKDELIRNAEQVDLARPEIEHFYTKNILLLVINGKEYKWDKEYISGNQIKELGNIPQDDELFLSIKKPWEDEPVPDDKEINLALPGIEHFYSKTSAVIKLTIQTTKGNWTDSFEKQLTIQQLIQKVVTKYAFAADGNYALKLKGATENLDANRTIGSYHFPSGQILVFTDLGKGA